MMFAEKSKKLFPYSRLEIVFPLKGADNPEFKEIAHILGVPFMIKETTSVGAFSSSLKLPVGGSRSYTRGSLSGISSSGVYCGQIQLAVTFQNYFILTRVVLQ